MTQSPPPTDPVKAAWLSQPVELSQLTATELAAAAGGFERKIRRRNRLEYVGGCFAILVFASMAFISHQGWIGRVGDVVMVLGVIFVLWQLHRRSSPARTPAGGTTESLLDFQRAELARQRDALKAVPVWYLLPCVPGFIVLGLGNLLQAPRRFGFQQSLVMAVVGWVIIALVFVAIWLLNAWAAERLDRAVERIDRLRRE